MGNTDMLEILEELHRKKERAKMGGGIEKLKQHQAAGYYTARERVEKLLDPHTFLELGLLAHSERDETGEKSAGDGVITGIGKIQGRPVVVQAADKTVFAGTEGIVYFRKVKAAHRFAIKRGFPVINLMEGGGLRMPDGMGSDGISQMLFPQELLTHHRKVPMITAILGDSFGGPTWTAVSSDFVVQVKGTTLAVAGPRMLEIATGEKITPEDLGGWQTHANDTGQVDRFVDHEDEAFEEIKQFLKYMPLNKDETPPLNINNEQYTTKDCEKLRSIVPTRQKRAYDMKKVILEIADEQSVFEIKAAYGKALITSLARIDGRVVGIIANNPLFFAGSASAKECEKATDFIVLCDSYHIPLIFLHDTPGFRVSAEAEKLKIPTKIMVWNQALAQSTVPKISIVIRKSIGAAYGNMCGPTMGADFVVAWPTAEINFTGPEVGINVVYDKYLKNSDHPEQLRKELLEKWNFDASPYKAAGGYFIDDIIDPAETRSFLENTLEYICYHKEMKSKRRLSNWPTGF